MKRCLLFSILVSSCYLSMGQITATFKPNATVGKDAPIMKFDNDCIATIATETPANRNYGAEIINGDTCTDCMKLCLGDVPRKVAEINTETEEIFVPQGVVPLGDEVGEMPGRETLKAVPNPTNDKWNIIFEASKKSEGIVNIYNVKGECLYSKNIHLEKGTNEFEVDCQTWQAGVYLLKITEDKNETSIRLNKQ